MGRYTDSARRGRAFRMWDRAAGAVLALVMLVAALAVAPAPAAAQGTDPQGVGGRGVSMSLAQASDALCGQAPATPAALRSAAAMMPVQGLLMRSALVDDTGEDGHLNMMPAGSPVRLSVQDISGTDSLIRVYAATSDSNSAGEVELQDMRRFGQSNGAEGPEVVAVLRPLKEVWAIWPNYTIYAVGCAKTDDATGNALTFIARADTRVSEPLMAGTLAAVAVAVLYLAACLMLHLGGGRGFTINPVVLTAGTDGRASITKLQILYFTLIVTGMLIYVLLRIGVLGDMSSDVLTLLGIAGVSAVAAKQTAVGRRRLSGSNWAWLRRQGWTPTKREPSAGDLVTENGEFDIYRFQTLVFSLVVGMSLLFTGLFGLSSFELSPALLGLLGISQTIYVGGKAVSRPQISELNKKITELRNMARERVEADAGIIPSTVVATSEDAADSKGQLEGKAEVVTDQQLTTTLRDVASMVRDTLGGTWTLPNTVEPGKLL